MEFKFFLIESEANDLKDVKETLAKLPKKHSDLVKDFTFKFQASNTLNKDNKHIGVIDLKKKEITIAAPWNYGREYTILHELAHLIWQQFVDKKMRAKWTEIVKNTKDKMKDVPEELFCMAYANYYAQNQIVIHTHPEWEKFIKLLVTE